MWESTHGCPSSSTHNLFFDTPFGPHAETIYDTQTWPDDPLFYISAPSKTDSGIAPEGHENMFFLIPLAPGLKDEPGLRDRYFEEMCDRLAKARWDGHSSSHCVQTILRSRGV